MAGLSAETVVLKHVMKNLKESKFWLRTFAY